MSNCLIKNFNVFLFLSLLEHMKEALQNMKVLYFLLFCWSFLLAWIPIRTPVLDPDALLNPDTDPKHCPNLSHNLLVPFGIPPMC